MKKDEYKIIVALYVRGDDLDPDTVTTALGTSPSQFQRKGERRVTSTNREYVAKIGMWGLIADSDSRVLADHISQLASRIAMEGDVLNTLTGVQEAYVDIFIAATSDEDGGGTCKFELSKEVLAALERIGLPVRFTVSLGTE